MVDYLIKRFKITRFKRLWYHTFEVTDREWNTKKLENDEKLNVEGRIIDSVLSEHICEGMLEGYLLTGRHGIFDSYEAFIRIVDSMVSQHAKWLKVCNELEWRKPIPSLNILLTSHIWQQDHNGFTHQDPGFLNHIAVKKADTARIYLPPDANCLISTVDHCLASKNYINAIVASKHPRMQWFTKDEAIKLCEQGLAIGKWASNDEKTRYNNGICWRYSNFRSISCNNNIKKKISKSKNKSSDCSWLDEATI